MPSKLNAAWHRANRMPARAALEQRVEWHLAHAKACGCRDLPAGIVRELERRGIGPSTRTAADEWRVVGTIRSALGGLGSCSELPDGQGLEEASTFEGDARRESFPAEHFQYRREIRVGRVNHEQNAVPG